MITDNDYDPDLSEQVNIARGLFAIARALDGLSYQVKFLGNGNAAGSMGAVETLSVELRQGLDGIGQNIGDLAEAMKREG
jgi:hypothetical protein